MGKSVVGGRDASLGESPLKDQAGEKPLVGSKGRSRPTEPAAPLAKKARLEAEGTSRIPKRPAKGVGVVGAGS